MLPRTLSRAPSHEELFKKDFLAMTFVKGPRQASFVDDKPAKLRFFLGYTDEFTPGDGSDRVSGVRYLPNDKRQTHSVGHEK